jgi:hypothetical protein
MLSHSVFKVPMALKLLVACPELMSPLKAAWMLLRCVAVQFGMCSWVWDGAKVLADMVRCFLANTSLEVRWNN